MVYFKIPALDATIMEGCGPPPQKKMFWLPENTWKYLQVPFKKYQLLMPKNQLEIPHGVLKDISRHDLNCGWPFGCLVICKNAATFLLM